MNISEINYKRINTNNELNRLVDLMNVCFHKQVNVKYFQWKYFNNPAGKAIAFEAIYQQKTIAFYGVIPEKYTVDGKNYRVFQSVDTMTHPDFQKKGLFVILAQLTYAEIIKEYNSYFLIGFPGSQSYQGFIKKLSWKSTFIGSYIFTNKLFFYPIFFIKKKYSVVFKQLQKNDETIPRYFSNTLQNEASIFKTISPELLYWKVFDNPIKKYNIVGIFENEKTIGMFIYLIDAKNTCEITWLHFLDEQKYFKHSHTLIDYLFKTTNKKFIYTWRPQNSQRLKLLRNLGFIYNPLKKGPFSAAFPFITKSHTTIFEVDWNQNNIDFQPIMLD
ncbi:MAG TPA: GNAT family N-acetyltransferase [Bacteroidia bacterium]|nr:GNAT family N-acetyltransferase [Bacteroidia bacterium]